MQITSYEDLTPDNIIFNEAKEYKVKDSKIRYKRIPIEVKYPNGKKGQLIIETPLLFSFGVNEKKNQETNKLVGYSIPICLWAKDSEPNTQEKAFFEAINNITTIFQEHLESEYGADLASSLSEPFYYKQVEYPDKKGKTKTKRDPSHECYITPLKPRESLLTIEEENEESESESESESEGDYTKDGLEELIVKVNNEG